MLRTTSLPNVPELRSPSWCANGHVHTIARSFWGDTNPPYDQRIEIPTPDDDFLELDIIRYQNDKPVIALFHGLEGSTKRYYMVELARELSKMKLSVVAVNFRSCGSRMNRRPRFYHSGETNDYATVFRWMQKEFPNKLIGAVGFSLGGNALLKSLSEEGMAHPVITAVGVSVPYDLRLGSINLTGGFNRVYDYRFLRTLTKKLEQKKKHYPELPDFCGSTLYDFDDQVTSVIHGFRNAEDYYARCSSRKFISDIKKPTLLIHSDEDPLCPIDGMPLGEIKENPHLHYIITDEGGHLGFWSQPAGWLNYIITAYLAEELGLNEQE